jgi:hypothetical protein
MFLPTLKSGLGFGDSGSGTKGLGTRHGSQKFIAYVEDPGRRYPFDCARDVRQFCYALQRQDTKEPLIRS